MAGVAAPWALNLAALGEVAAAPGEDYKALVCIFLYGGNDQGNTIIPVDAANHARYAAIRGSCTVARDSLTATTLSPVDPLNGMQLALAPEMTGLKNLFDAGKLAVQLNVGSLIMPTTVRQFQERTIALPPKLFSHNDQQSYWQSSLPEGAVSGWGGRLGELMSASNAQTAFTCISANGNAVYLSGERLAATQVSTNGAIAVNAFKQGLYGSSACAAALSRLMVQASDQTLKNEYAQLTARAIDAEGKLTMALKDVATMNTVFDSRNSLAMQLKIVANLIAARHSLGMKRQVFLVGLGGFDVHNNLNTLQPVLLGKLSSAMTAFYEATAELGVAENVTTFTASDFGRTLVVNGDGSDHGWGAHHFVMGGAVRGRRFYGQAPGFDLNGPEYARGGVLVPTTSTDQYSATLAKWFGASDAELPRVAPNLRNFNVKTLGFV